MKFGPLISIGPHKKPPKSPTKRQKAKTPFLQSPAFAAICAMVAILYIGYRLFLLGVSTATVQHAIHPAQSVVCSSAADGDGSATTGAARLSNSYQARIAAEPATGPNLVANADLSAYDDDNRSPASFSRIDENNALTYSDQRDSSRHFLRVVHSGKTAQTVTGGWVMGLVPMQRGATYAYQLSYRATAPVTISIEYRDAQSKPAYKNITQLSPSKNWQRFSANFDNVVNAKDFRVIASIQQNGRLDTRDYNVHRMPSAELSRGVVSLTFDDGWQSFADKAAPLLKKYHMPSTAFIISRVSDKAAPGYMTMPTLQKLHAQGVEIGSHSLTHCDQTKLTPALIQQNATESQATLQQHNLGPVKTFAYPYGAYDQTTQDIYSKTYPFIRTSDEGYNDRYFDPQNVHSFAIGANTTDAQFRSYVRYAATHHVWVVLAYHQFDGKGAYNVSDKTFEHQLQQIRQSDVSVESFYDAANSIAH